MSLWKAGEGSGDLDRKEVVFTRMELGSFRRGEENLFYFIYISSFFFIMCVFFKFSNEVIDLDIKQRMYNDKEGVDTGI